MDALFQFVHANTHARVLSLVQERVLIGGLKVRHVAGGVDLPSMRIPLLKPDQKEVLSRSMHDLFFRGLPYGSVVRVGVHGEGSCFFHSVAYILNCKGYRTLPVNERMRVGQEYRCSLRENTTGDVGYDIVRRMRPDLIHRARDDLFNDMCVATRWADETMIACVSKVEKLNIVFLGTTNGEFYCPLWDPEHEHEATIVILWANSSHFEPILFLPEGADIKRMNSNDMIGVVSQYGSQQQRDILHTIRENFQSACVVRS